ncbi:MAG: SRPBCC family protein [Nocardioidaceae bacterium]
MKVSGSVILSAPRDHVWEALNDPAVLVRTIPGCQRLLATGPDVYTMTITAGVAAIKGVFQGEVRLTDQQPPNTFVLKAAGAGTPGTVSADVLVTLTEEDGGQRTALRYDADAIVGGMIGGVGQRMLTGVSKKTAAEFFSAVDDVLTGKQPSAAEAQASPSNASADAKAQPGTGVFEAPGAPAVSGRPNTAGFLSGALVGAGAALVGVLVGGWLAGRRRP